MLKIVSKEVVPISVLTSTRSLHLLPNVPKDVEPYEWDQIQQQCPDARILVLSVANPNQAVAPRQKIVETNGVKDGIEVKLSIESKQYSEVASHLIAKSVSAIISELEEKERMMGGDEYVALLQELLDLEQDAEVNRESPRVTLVRHLETELEC